MTRPTWVAPLREAGIEVDCRLIEGDAPAGGIARVADQVGADLIVIGAHRERHLAGRLSGDVVRRLGALVAVPMVVVPLGPALPAAAAARAMAAPTHR